LYNEWKSLHLQRTFTDFLSNLYPSSCPYKVNFCVYFGSYFSFHQEMADVEIDSRRVLDRYSFVYLSCHAFKLDINIYLQCVWKKVETLKRSLASIQTH